MKSGRLKFFEVLGWAVLVLMSFIGIAGSTVHLLDTGFRVGDIHSFKDTTYKLYGPDFAPHWYNFRMSPVVRVAHMAPGLFWMIFAPMQFIGRIRRAAPRFHRWVGRITLAMTVILIPSGVLFAALHPFQGALEELAPIIFYTVVYLLCAVTGLRAALRKDFVSHREWMIRAFSIGIGISSVRVWFVLFQNTTGWHGQQFFSTTFWLAFGVNLLVAEIWINMTRSRTQARATEILGERAVAASRPALHPAAKVA